MSQIHKIALQFDLLTNRSMLQHIRNDVRQIFLCHQFFLVAQFDDTLRHLAHSIFIQLQSEVFEIFADIGFAACLAQRIFTFTAKAFGKQIITVKIIFVIAVGMHTCHLCKDILTYNRFIGRYHNTRIRLHYPADIIQTALVDIGRRIEMIFQDGLHTCERSISSPFAQSVDGGMQSFDTA